MRLGKRKVDALEGVNLLDLRPVRVADWEVVGDRVVIRRPRVEVRGPRDALNWFLHQMSARRIRLDEVGSCAWLLLDGDRSVQDVASRMREEFGDRVEPVEERLGHLIRGLHGEEFLVYPGHDRKTPVPGRQLG